VCKNGKGIFIRINLGIATAKRIYGTVAPTGSGYTKIYSNRYAFAALTTNGSIKAWGDWDWGGTHTPSGSGYTKIYSTLNAFAALTADGSINSKMQRINTHNLNFC
jgi:hypothetical protein